LAEEELEAARTLLAAGLARVALSRAYFAAFHAVRALLYSEGLEPRTHQGVQHLFNTHFLRTGRYAASSARLLARLQKFREEADYARVFVVDDAGVTEELAAASELVARIRNELIS
jgi:uncharacterized protein (UPF0332 family)